MRLTGAKAYAKWVGKRLPTPYEWSIAAFGRYGGNRDPDWADKYIKARRDAWVKIVEDHFEYAESNPAVLPAGITDPAFAAEWPYLPDWTHPLLYEFVNLP